jgi:hypothetical protein
MLSSRTTPFDVFTCTYYWEPFGLIQVLMIVFKLEVVYRASISGPTERRRRSKTLVVWGTEWLAMGCEEEH